MVMRIGTWNVNSVRVREDRLLGLLERHAPDVLALQEIKVESHAFPREGVEALGYHVTAYGQKTYNGVALLSRTPAEDVIQGFDDGEEEDPQARLLAARFGDTHVISAYFPNGGELGSDKYAYKLAWMRRLRRWLDRHADASQAWALVGDYNVAPVEADVAMPERWRDTTLTSDEVRAALTEIQAFGLVDVLATPSRGRPVLVVGLPEAGLPQGRWSAHRSRLRDGAARGAIHRRLHRPGRAQGQAALGPRPRLPRPRMKRP